MGLCQPVVPPLSVFIWQLLWSLRRLFSSYSLSAVSSHKYIFPLLRDYLEKILVATTYKVLRYLFFPLQLEKGSDQQETLMR